MNALFRTYEQQIVDAWVEAALAHYGATTVCFLKCEQDAFANPFGVTLRNSPTAIFQSLSQELQDHQVGPYLDEIIKVQAIQDLAPSQALGFLFGIKEIIRRELGARLNEPGLLLEVIWMDERVDQLVLMAFDIYMRRREKLYELRVEDVKRNVSALYRRLQGGS